MILLVNQNTMPLLSTYSPIQISRQTSASLWLLSASLVWGLFPLAVVASDGGSSPFGFLAVWGVGDAAASFICLLLLRQRRLCSWKSMCSYLPARGCFLARLDASNDRWNWSVLVALCRSTMIALFALSITMIPDAVATILYYIWPPVLVLMLRYLFREDGRFSFPKNSLLLFVFIFAGAGLAIGSISGNSESGYETATIVAGVAVLAVAIVLSVMEAHFVRWAEVSQTNTPNDSRQADTISELADKAGRIILLRGISGLVGAIVGLAVAIPTSKLLGGSDSLLAFVLAFCLSGLGHYTNAVGTLKSHVNSGLQAIRYATPVFAIGFLWLFGFAQGVRPDFFLVGTTMIIAGNLLMHFTSQRT